MRTHDEEHVSGEPRPAAQRRADEESALLASRALEAGRPDMLDVKGVQHLQRTAGNEAVAQLMAGEPGEEESPVKTVAGSSGGQPLDESVRTRMESHLGADFSDVRIHTSTQADESARSLHAQAYTVGSDIAFRNGLYSPDTDDGQRMLAHELTHVVQQRSGPVDGTSVPGGIKVSHPSDRFEQEAERSADAFMSAAPPEAAAPVSPADPGPSASLSAQRMDDDEEEELQGMFVQRQEAEDEEEWAEEY